MMAGSSANVLEGSDESPGQAKEDSTKEYMTCRLLKSLETKRNAKNSTGQPSIIAIIITFVAAIFIQCNLSKWTSLGLRCATTAIDAH